MAKNILFVLPFYKGDEGQAVELCRYIAELSGNQKIGQQALIVAAAGASVARVKPELARSFDSVKAIEMTTAPMLEPGEASWPKSCNLQFIHTCEFLREWPGIDAFYYFEPDHVPLAPDWWQKICAEYDRCGQPFMGAKFQHNLNDARGNVLKGDHLIGTAIYPKNAWNRLPVLHNLERDPNMIVPWDVLIASHVVLHSHFSPLIGNRHAARGFKADGTAVFANSGAETMSRRDSGLNDGHAVFHGCKDASLLRVMRQKRGMAPMSLSFLHSGDLGDVVYALAGTKAVGGGTFFLTEKRPAREALTPERMAVLTPLIAAQPYITEVKAWQGQWVHFNFTGFRRSLVHHRNLAEAQADWIGADAECVNKKWLTVEPELHSFDVIINRTSRYHNEGFPWIGTGGFIGTDAEYTDFSNLHGKLTHYPTKDLLEAARVIAGAKKFYGNQSVCYAIAEGLKIETFQETYEQDRNCLFPRANGRYWFDGKWHQGDQLSLPKKETQVVENKVITEQNKNVSAIETLVLELKKFCKSPIETGRVYDVLEAHGLRPTPKKAKKIRRRSTRKCHKNSLTLNT